MLFHRSTQTNSGNECILVSLCELFGFSDKEEAKEWLFEFKSSRNIPTRMKEAWTMNAASVFIHLDEVTKDKPIEIKGLLYKFKYHHICSGTVGSIARLNPQRTIWCLTTNHSAVAKGGKVVDSWDSSRRRVLTILEINRCTNEGETLFENDPIFTNDEDLATYKRVKKLVDKGISLEKAKRDILNQVHWSKNEDYYFAVKTCLEFNLWEGSLK